MNETASTAPNARLSAERTDRKQRQSTYAKKGYFTIFPQVANFSLKCYATNETIAETELDIMRFANPSNMKPSLYAEDLLIKRIRCGVVFKEYALNNIFNESLDTSIRHSMREFWKNKKEGNQHDPTFHTTSLHRLRGHNISSKQTNPTGSDPQSQFGK